MLAQPWLKDGSFQSFNSTHTPTSRKHARKKHCPKHYQTRAHTHTRIALSIRCFSSLPTKTGQSFAQRTWSDGRARSSDSVASRGGAEIPPTIVSRGFFMNGVPTARALTRQPLCSIRPGRFAVYFSGRESFSRRAVGGPKMRDWPTNNSAPLKTATSISPISPSLSIFVSLYLSTPMPIYRSLDRMVDWVGRICNTIWTAILRVVGG